MSVVAVHSHRASALHGERVARSHARFPGTWAEAAADAAHIARRRTLFAGQVLTGDAIGWHEWLIAADVAGWPEVTR